MTSTPALSSATAVSLHRAPSSTSLLTSRIPSSSSILITTTRTIKTTSISLRSISSTAASATSVENKASVSTTSAAEEGTDEDVERFEKLVGARVRVMAPLKVYHVPRVPEVDLMGKEGTVKQYIGVWKGKRISANLPYKIEFVVEVEGRGNVKFFAHLKEDEFEFL